MQNIIREQPVLFPQPQRKLLQMRRKKSSPKLEDPIGNGGFLHIVGTTSVSPS
jgi:hypothetical protein